MLKYLVAGFSVLFLSVSYASAGSSFAVKCVMKTPDNGTVIARNIIIWHTEGAKTAQVLDGIIQHYHKKPISAKVTNDTKKRLSLKWTVKAPSVKAGEHIPDLHYSTSYLKATGRLNISAHVSGYDDNNSAHGTCVPYGN